MTEEKGNSPDPWEESSTEVSESLPDTFAQEVSQHAQAKTSFLDLFGLILDQFSVS